MSKDFTSVAAKLAKQTTKPKPQEKDTSTQTKEPKRFKAANYGRKEKRNVRLNSLVTPTLAAKLKYLAAQNDRSANDVVNEVLGKYLNRRVADKDVK
ncbi:hypothetical protein [Lentilactobacillus otakiensis]|uniref:hypothetical protein n=1 Tax=Lentilactobacillus otakiensis TaxID=481720 RepID=UPI003D16A498